MRVAAALLAVLAAAPASALEVPPLTGRVVDLADVLSRTTEDALTAQLAVHEDSTSNQVVVLTIPSLDGQIVESYANKVHREWGLGLEGRDNGVLILIAVQDREVRIEVGYGLEGDLTDATSGSIIRDLIVPPFKDGDFDAGVLDGVAAVLEAADGTYEPRGPEEPPVNLVLAFISAPVVLILVLDLARELTKGAQESLDVAIVGPAVIGLMAAVSLPYFIRWEWVVLVGLAAYTAFKVWLGRWAEAHPRWGEIRRHNRAKSEAFRAARLRGETRVTVGSRSYSVPSISTSSRSGSSGSRSSSSFSGGGGSSGGGGASGSW
ncbi:TPM domain-containing protein [Rubrivirga sp.]|uniref:TPM domain-containing protein n=1 Tax=Rubrivirga sp. TaxID=1885344 RepID=UPI003C70947E